MRRLNSSVVALAVCLAIQPVPVGAFFASVTRCRSGSVSTDEVKRPSQLRERSDADDLLSSEAASKFKVVTCMSTTCSKKRQALNMDSLATFGAFYSRIRNSRAPSVQVEEGPCLGNCKYAPCVAIEHSDYEGTVSLEGMTPNEFECRVFHNVLTEADADRVWSCVENAVEVMQNTEDEEQE